MSTVYNYEIGVDTGASVVNSTLLQQQIMDSGMSPTGKADYEHINTSGTDLDISFVNALSGGDKTILDAVVLAHMGESLTENNQRVLQFGADTPNSGTWVNTLSLQAPLLSPGAWAIDTRCEIQLTTGAAFSGGGGNPANYPNRAVEARIRIDGADRVRWLSPWKDWTNMQASDVLDFVAGASPLIEMDFRLLGSGDTAEIRRRVISLSFLAGGENGGGG